MDRPILFSAPMVRALLAGTKTQTRRLWTMPRDHRWEDEAKGVLCYEGNGRVYGVDEIRCRYAVGDHLYVREAVAAEEREEGDDGVRYLADEKWIAIANTAQAAERWGGLFHYGKGLRGRNVPAMHMPRWASRLTLTVTDARVQRLQDISEADAIAEGVAPDGVCTAFACGPIPMWSADGGVTQGDDPINAYSALWDSLNAARGFGWEANPWVVAVSFTVERRNIDEES